LLDMQCFARIAGGIDAERTRHSQLCLTVLEIDMATTNRGCFFDYWAAGVCR